MTTLTAAQVDAFSATLGDIHLETSAAIDRLVSVRFADEETTFESCAYFREVGPDGSDAVMDFYAILPPRLKVRLDAACRDRVMQPGALKDVVLRAKQQYGNGAYQKAVLAFDFLENHIIVGEVLQRDFPPVTTVNSHSLRVLTTHVITGIMHRRLTLERKPPSGRLSADEATFAGATIYLVAMDRSENSYSTIDLLRHEPEKVFAVVSAIIEQSRVDPAQPLPV
jgi:hypothetical protein